MFDILQRHFERVEKSFELCNRAHRTQIALKMLTDEEKVEALHFTFFTSNNTAEHKNQSEINRIVKTKTGKMKLDTMEEWNTFIPIADGIADPAQRDFKELFIFKTLNRRELDVYYDQTPMRKRKRSYDAPQSPSKKPKSEQECNNWKNGTCNKGQKCPRKHVGPFGANRDGNTRGRGRFGQRGRGWRGRGNGRGNGRGRGRGRGSSGTCWKCNKPGHIARECKNKRQPAIIPICSKCQKGHHLPKDCYSVRSITGKMLKPHPSNPNNGSYGYNAYGTSNNYETPQQLAHRQDAERKAHSYYTQMMAAQPLNPPPTSTVTFANLPGDYNSEDNGQYPQ